MEPNSWDDVISALASEAGIEDVTTEKNDDVPNRERIKKAVLADIRRANDFYTSKVEPVLRMRHQIYEADREYYKKRFSNTAAQSDFVSFDFCSMVQWAIPMVMNSFFGGDDAVLIIGRMCHELKAENINQLSAHDTEQRISSALGLVQRRIRVQLRSGENLVGT